AVAGLRDRGLDGEFVAVFSQAVQNAQLASHLALGHARRAELLDISRMAGAKAVGYEAAERRTDGLRRRDAEHDLGRGVEDEYGLRFVDGDDGFHRRTDDAHHPRFAQALPVLPRRPIRGCVLFHGRISPGTFYRRRQPSPSCAPWP